MVSIDAGNVGRDEAIEDVPVDVPEADLVEQATAVDEDDERDESTQQVPLEVNPADAAEQHRSVPDDEDYPHA
ncbi:hypothetical protein [Prescottella subtropica]|uniref:hypothetical protein n=1 Tax=Prescottella subtropica TaxID=2545757 RepID=UPI0010F640FE|nr:hypothetical protein [Prescottella subtropica]